MTPPRIGREASRALGDSAAVVTSNSWVWIHVCAEQNGGLDLAMVAETG